MKFSLRQQGIGFAPFPVSPSGGKPGAPPPPLRYGSGKAPAPSKTLKRAFGAGKELFRLDGAPPRTPADLLYTAKADTSLAVSTGHPPTSTQHLRLPNSIRRTMSYTLSRPRE